MISHGVFSINFFIGNFLSKKLYLTTIGYNQSLFLMNLLKNCGSKDLNDEIDILERFKFKIFKLGMNIHVVFFKNYSDKFIPRSIFFCSHSLK